MRNKFFGGAMAALLVFVASAFTFAPDAPATVFRADPAGVIWFDGNGTPTFVPDANLQIVVTNNANGNTNIRVTGQLPAGAALPSRAQHYNPANTGFICTFTVPEFRGTTTPSGQFSFQCHGP